MLRRTAVLLAARLTMARRGGGAVPALVFLSVLGATLALLVRDALPPFPYLLFALTLGALLLALPLLSDLGAILRHDEAAEWVAALPVRAWERTLARTLHLLVLLATLAAAWSLPWSLLAADLSLGARLALPFLVLSLTLVVATLLIWLQQALLPRFEGVFVTIETGLVVGLVVALVQLLGRLPELARLTPDGAALSWLPPAWFARAPFAGPAGWTVPLAAAGACLAALLAVPARDERRGRRRSLLEWALEPLRRLALATWVRVEERGAFELVYRALPREREVALRTVPMLGIPLAFLIIGARASERAGSGDALALLLFTVGVYLPLLLTHVPLSESAGAAWILRCAPQPRAAVDAGAIKALFVRWILPLYLAQLAAGLALGEFELLARLWLPALLLALLVLRFSYRRCARELPLSVAPADLRGDVDWAGHVTTLAIVLTLVAVLANRFLSWPMGLAAAALLGLGEWRLARSARAPARA